LFVSGVAQDDRSMSTVHISFDTRAFSIETVQKAALKFTRLASFEFLPKGEHELQVAVRAISGVELVGDQFAALFRNEVLDQHLRGVVARETETERNLILAYAFSNTKLIAS